MNTVEALNVLGKALCGDSFEVKPGLTDAETILEIAKNYTGGGGESGNNPMVVPVTIDANPNNPDQYTATLGNTWQEIADAFNSGQTVLVEVEGERTSVAAVGYRLYDDESAAYNVTITSWPYNNYNYTTAAFTASAPDMAPVFVNT